MAQTLIQSGASFQAVLLQSGESEIKSIGTAIYQMHKYSTGKFLKNHFDAPKVVFSYSTRTFIQLIP